MSDCYLLDTNIISDAVRPIPDPALERWMEARADGDLFIASIILGEIWQGLLVMADGKRKRSLLRWFGGPSGPPSLFAGRILPFDEAAAIQWAEFLAEGRRLGQPRSAIDMQIAAIAKVNACTVVTRNRAHIAAVEDQVAVFDPTRQSASG